jgi:hypothetical protein
MKLVVASRLHLGKASQPPSREHIQKVLDNLGSIATSVEHIYETSVLISVDATPKIEGYSYVESIKKVLSENEYNTKIEIIPVTPWGKFVPALNALVRHAKAECSAELIMFLSAEVNVSASTVETLCQHVISDRHVIVAGAAMNGHEYAGAGKTVPLTGRTTPWNTLCVWDLSKLSMTGFIMVSDFGNAGGVEECAAIALLQRLFPDSVAKLVKVNDFSWENSFQDPERQKWHEEKMKSKVERPAQQLELLKLSGSVLHC